MSDLATPTRTVRVVEETSNWSVQDRWGSYWLLFFSAVGMLLGVALGLLWTVLAVLGAIRHSWLIAAMTGGFALGCIVLAFKFPYVAQRRPYWQWPMISVAVLAWISASFSAASFVCNYAVPQETLRSMPARQIERLRDDLYARRGLLKYAYACTKGHNPFYCAWYWAALQPAEMAYDEELYRRVHERADLAPA